MSTSPAKIRSVIVEREIHHPPQKVWRALTQPHLIEEWMMKNDFMPVVGRRFDLRADWGTVNCEVLEIQTERILSYTWHAMGLESIVTWTLTPAGEGTHLRMEQSGFLASQEQAFQGATYGWQRFLGNLEQLLSRAS